MPYNPKSLLNLKNGFKDRDLAVAAGIKGNQVQRDNKAKEKAVEKYMNDLAALAFSKSTEEDFIEAAKNAPSQALRIVALNLADKRTAMDTLKWLIERIDGKPKQKVEGTLDTTIGAKKPTIIFKDVKGEAVDDGNGE